MVDLQVFLHCPGFNVAVGVQRDVGQLLKIQNVILPKPRANKNKIETAVLTTAFFIVLIKS